MAIPTKKHFSVFLPSVIDARSHCSMLTACYCSKILFPLKPGIGISIQHQVINLPDPVWVIKTVLVFNLYTRENDIYLYFSNICKATTVTHTKGIYRNLLRKETSFMYYTSSVLRKSRHMKQKEKITHCC